MEHVSVSPKKKFRVPTWDDMCVLKDVFFEDEEEASQIHRKRVNMSMLWRTACIFGSRRGMKSMS